MGMIAVVHIDWLRALVDIVGAFAIGYISYGVGIARGRERERGRPQRCPSVSPFDQKQCSLHAGHGGRHSSAHSSSGVQFWLADAKSITPDRDDERLP